LNVGVYSLGRKKISSFRIVDVFMNMNLFQSPEVIHPPFQGYHGDTSKTFLCGDVDEASKQLVKVSISLSRTHVLHLPAVFIFVVMISILNAFLTLFVICFPLILHST
jgi:hypothetical protein